MRSMPITKYDFITMAISKVEDPTQVEQIKHEVSKLPTCFLRNSMSDELKFSRKDIITFFELNYTNNVNGVKNARDVTKMNMDHIKKISEWYTKNIGLAIAKSCDPDSAISPIVNWTSVTEQLIAMKFNTRKFLKERHLLVNKDTFIDWAIQVTLQLKKLRANELRFLLYVGISQM